MAVTHEALARDLRQQDVHQGTSLGVRRVLTIVAVSVALVGGFAWTGPDAAAVAVERAGSDLVRLLRAMAVIKAFMVAGAVSALVWRLSAPVSNPSLAGYVAGASSAAFGLGLMWHLAFIGTGTFLLHAGLIGLAVMLWRDPVVPDLLAKFTKRKLRSDQHA